MQMYRVALSLAAAFSLISCGPGAEAPPPEPSTIDSIFPTGWQYDVETDPMTGKANYLACIMSEDKVVNPTTLELARGRLCLRDDSTRGRDSFVSIPAGISMDCNSSDPCSVRVRFDEKPAVSLGGVQPSGVYNMIIFAGRSGERALWSGVPAASVTRVEVTIFSGGRHVFTFKTAGLDKAKINRT